MQKTLIALLLLSFAACSEEPPPPKPKKAPEPAAVKKTVPAPEPVPEKKEEPKPATPDTPKVLLDPTLADWNLTAPAEFKAKFTTSKGDFVILVTREWAPRAADRFYALVKNGFYNDVRFFRVVSGFMAQFGMNGDPRVTQAWMTAKIPDDPVTQSNTRGMVTFATSGKNSRTTQIFINFADKNARLDGMGFAPFGKIAEGMDVVDKLYSGYGEGAPGGNGPAQQLIQREGNEYLNRDFKELDYVKSATIVP